MPAPASIHHSTHTHTHTHTHARARALKPMLTIAPVPVLLVKLNGNRTVQGTLRGFDQFMNLVLDDTMEIVRVEPRHAIASPASLVASET